MENFSAYASVHTLRLLQKMCLFPGNEQSWKTEKLKARHHIIPTGTGDKDFKMAAGEFSKHKSEY